MNRVVFTCGDINGIGPEVTIKTLNRILPANKNTQFILIIPKNVFTSISNLISPEFDYKLLSKSDNLKGFSAQVLINTINSSAQTLGKPTINSGKSSYEALKISFQMIQHSFADAVVTAPVSKTALKFAGSKYPGQTEMFADWCGSKNFVMTFLSKKIRVALYSIHIPLKDVHKSLNSKLLKIKLDILIKMLRNDLGIAIPRIAVLGLNPHAGENGIIGEEEKLILQPTLKKTKALGILDGPFSPDAFFANKLFKKYDLALGLYHDQVLIPFKYINSGRGVNFTAGLPIIRTSPDHGVAYDIAGQGIADESSMIEAFKYAKLIHHNRLASRKIE